MPPFRVNWSDDYRNKEAGIAMKIAKGVVDLIFDEPALKTGVLSPCVIAYIDMDDKTGLNKLDPADLRYPILRTLVDWGMGFSRPYIVEIEISDEKLTVTFLQNDNTYTPHDDVDIYSLMLMLFRTAGTEGRFVRSQ